MGIFLKLFDVVELREGRLGLVSTQTHRLPLSTLLIALGRVSLLAGIRKGEARGGWALVGLEG